MRLTLQDTFVLWVAGIIPSVVASQQPVPVARPLVFDRVTIVDVERGKLLPKQRVVIAGNRIQTVGAMGAVKLPQHAQVVDARGKYLIPGLWDMHVHPAQYGLYFASELFYPLFIANGVTGIRDAWTSEPIERQVQLWHEILAGTRVGPTRQLLAGPAHHLYEYNERPEDIQKTVDSLKAAGANFLKTYPFTFEVAAAIRRAGLPFGGHVEFRAGISKGPVSAIEASDSGISIIDHVGSAGGLDTLCMGPQASVARCQPVAERLRRNNTWFAPTLMAYAYWPEPHTGQASRDFMQRFRSFFTCFWKSETLDTLALGTLRAALRSGVGRPAADSTADSLGLQIVRRVALPLVAGTDAISGPSSGDPPYGPANDEVLLKPAGFSLHAELALYVLEGLTPLEALQTATLNPAKMLRATDSLGTVAAGKLADLVLLDADPLADILNTMAIRAVVANGRYFDRAALDALLTDSKAKVQAHLKVRRLEGDGAWLSPKSFIALDSIGALLQADPTLRVEIGVHTDSASSNTAAAAQRLTDFQADVVRGYLTQRGAAAEQILARGYGVTQPLTLDSTAAGNARNRRIEIHWIASGR